MATFSPPTVKCPICGTPVEWTDASRHRPFCSERCRLIDLGAWASDGYVLPGATADNAEETPPSEAPSSKH